jgi:hypothetical protein
MSHSHAGTGLLLTSYYLNLMLVRMEILSRSKLFIFEIRFARIIVVFDNEMVTVTVVLIINFILLLQISQFFISWFQAFVMFWMSCVIFLVVHRRMVFNSRRFGTLFHLHRQVDAKWVRVEGFSVVNMYKLD